MPGQLRQHHVLVADQAEASRLHNKGHFGTPRSGGAITLTLAEAAFLVENGRLEVRDEDGTVPLGRLVRTAAADHERFEVEYLVYRELRTRGYLLSAGAPADRRRHVHLLGYGRGEKPTRTDPSLWISAWSERDPVETDRLLALAVAGAAAGVENIVALVDEESDLTYYRLATAEPAGTRTGEPKAAADGILLRDRVAVWDPGQAKALHAEAFYGKPVADGLQISLVEALYLAKQGCLTVVDGTDDAPLGTAKLKARAQAVDPDVLDRLHVYQDLRGRGLTVKTGFKFGTHFRAYTDDPRGHHAPLLVHVVRRGSTMGWSTVSRAVRLSHSVRKSFLFAVIDGRRVAYVHLARHRP
jgi:tRNA-intron endonuclease